MSKYSLLEDYLKAHAGRENIQMSFAQIERILGFKLPPSAHKYRAWWSNNGANNVMTEAWLNAGFETENVDMPGGRLAFRPVKTAGKTSHGSVKESVGYSFVRKSTHEEKTEENKPKRHPIFGAMKDYFIIPPDLDLTAPLWEEGQSYDDFT